MLPPLRSEPRHWLSSDFQVLHATTELNPLCSRALLIPKNAKSKNQ